MKSLEDSKARRLYPKGIKINQPKVVSLRTTLGIHTNRKPTLKGLQQLFNPVN